MDGFIGKAGEVTFDPPMVGDSRVAEWLRGMTVRAARSNVTVLIEGESGTGKEVVARNIHRLSTRADGPLVILNAAEIPNSLLQSELFGYVKGTFTGAVTDRRGLVEEAGGGTFFLDEIGELPLSLQASLLRVIQEREVRRIGESRRRKVDVRFVFATNKDLISMVREGLFRMDLFYRISCVRIMIPPLRERKDDIEALCDYFMKQFSSDYGVPGPLLPPETVEYLRSYDWPGNIRELRNEIERIIALYGHVEKITPGMFSFDGRFAFQGAFDTEGLLNESACLLACTDMSGTGGWTGVKAEYPCNGYPMEMPGGTGKGPFTLKEAVERLERSAIISALRFHGGNKSRTASSLGITRQGLLKKMRRYGIGREKQFP